MDNILFVDDETTLFEIIRRKLAKLPVELYFAKSGEEALEIMETTEIKVVVTDLRMPGINGITLLDNVTKLYPNIIKIVMSFARDLNTIIAAIEKGQIFRYISKPIRYEEELIPAVKEALDEYDAKIAKYESVSKLAAINLELVKKNEIISEMENRERLYKDVVVNLLRRFAHEVLIFNEDASEFFADVETENYSKTKIIAENQKIRDFAKSILHHLEERVNK